MSEVCEDCERPRATTAHEEATDGYCATFSGCHLATIALLRQKLAAAERELSRAQAEIAGLRAVVEAADEMWDGLPRNASCAVDYCAARIKLGSPPGAPI